MFTLTHGGVSFSRLLAGKPAPIRSEDCFRLSGWHVWCSSIVRDVSGRYHLFYCRWPDSAGYDAWVTHSEIGRASAHSLDEPFQHEEVIFSRESSTAWDAHVFHNVTVKNYNGKFYMYYMGNCGNDEWWNHRNHQRIGVAWADHPEGPWHRFSEPLIATTTGSWDSLMVSNPTVTDTPDGRYLMLYKGVGEGKMPFGGRVLHGLAWAQHPEGPFIKEARPVLEQPGVKFAFEDPFLWREGDVYYCLVKDMQGYVSPLRECSLIVMRSNDGRNWQIAKPPIAISRTLEFEKGSHCHFERVERPQLFWDEATQKLWLVAAVKSADPDELSFSVRIAFS